ncbi:caspase family protein [Abyssibius alkaniclasticus]|uniref:caspase family protein n=1 Tax=Abyssibius alkaniclasticus TaxID=2881234 RepID=UPI00405A43D7
MFLKRIVLVLLIATAPAGAYAANRVALLIGNSNYDNPDLSLRNPVNDAELLAQSLRDLDFDVTVVTDEDRDGMQAAINDFGAAAEGAEMAVFFYAGHGVQIDGSNYLIGRDFSGNDVDALLAGGLPMGAVRDVLTVAKPEIGIIILDACRNNPFVESGTVPKGLARSQGGAGLLLAYSTDPGNVAYDGAGNNSVFAEALANNLPTDGLEARLMFGRVRQEVILATRGAQVPWVEEATLGEHYFANPGDTPAVNVASAREMQVWREISVRSDIEPFEAYIADFPDGMFRQFAEDRIRMLQQARLSGSRAGQTSGEILANAEPTRVAAALETLGFLTDTRSLSIVTQNSLTSAFDVYRAQLLNPETATPETLYVDAARMTMFLAATTAQQIRTDIVALSAIDRTLTIARDALRQIEDIAASNPDALPLLQQARADVDAITASQNEVLARLDATRTYYQSLLDNAYENFPDEITYDLMDVQGTSGGLSRLQERLARDAEQFVRHVQGLTPENKGTYAWLIDFLPKT